jgi:hypothetical protein
MKMKKKMKIGELKQDESVLEIRRVNPMFVSRYRQAMRNGAEFPPLIVEAGTNVIISGNHRYEAMMQEYPDTWEVECIVAKYANEAERIEAVVRENATHGNPLDSWSRKKAALKLAELGRGAEEIGRLLGVSVKRVEDYGGQTVLVRNGKQTKRMPVKAHFPAMGERVSAEDYAQHVAHDRGVHFVPLAKQLARWIRAGWVNPEEEKVAGAFHELKEAINAI